MVLQAAHDEYILLFSSSNQQDDSSCANELPRMAQASHLPLLLMLDITKYFSAN